MKSKLSSRKTAKALSRIDTIGIDEARDLLRRYFDRVVTMRQAAIEINNRLADVEYQLHDKARQASALEAALREVQQDYDRILVQQRNEQEREKHFLLQQLNETRASVQAITLRPGEDGAAKLVEMAKELDYYKQSSHDLRKKLKEFERLAASQPSLASDQIAHAPRLIATAVPRQAPEPGDRPTTIEVRKLLCEYFRPNQHRASRGRASQKARAHRPSRRPRCTCCVAGLIRTLKRICRLTVAAESLPSELPRMSSVKEYSLYYHVYTHPRRQSD